MLSALWSRMKTFLTYLFLLCIGLLTLFSLLGGGADVGTAVAQEDQERAVTDPDRLHDLEDLLVRGNELVDFALKDLTPDELRILRNTIYARHGRVFVDEELQKYFESKKWYAPKEDYSDDLLTAEDHRNVAAVLLKEDRPEDARWQESVALSKQAEDLADVASNIDILNAYLTDKEALEDGDAPEGFELPPLEYYKQAGIVVPLTEKAE